MITLKSEKELFVECWENQKGCQKEKKEANHQRKK